MIEVINSPVVIIVVDLLIHAVVSKLELVFTEELELKIQSFCSQ